MDVLANLISYYNNGENEVFHYTLRELLKHYDTLNASTIYDVAALCSSSTATVSRLAVQLGYRSYSDFKHNFFDSMHEYYYMNRILPDEQSTPSEKLFDSYFDSLTSIANKVRSSVSMEQLEQICQALHNADSIHFCSFYTQFSELWLQINLMFNGKVTVLNPRFHEQIEDIKSIQKGSMVLVVAPSDSSGLDVLPLMVSAHEQEAKVVFITNSTHSHYRDKADFFLAFDGDGSRLDMNGMQMYFDLISLIYRNRYIDSKDRIV